METPFTDLLDLRAFCLVVDLGSITAAAKGLGEGKGSVSRRLTRLEEAVGVRLLRRSPRLVQATDEGAAFRVQVGRALDALDDAAQTIHNTRTTPSGHLRITAPVDLAVGLLPLLIGGFTERYPQVTVEMLLTEKLLDFDAHQVDVALRAAGVLTDSSLVAHKLVDIDISLYAAPAYLAKRGAPRRPSDLASHRFFLWKTLRGTSTLTLRKKNHLRDKAIEVEIPVAVGASDFGFCRALALTGGGITALPSPIVRADLASGALVRVLPDLSAGEAGIYLLHSGSKLLSPKVRAFRDYVDHEWTEHPSRVGKRPVSESAT